MQNHRLKQQQHQQQQQQQQAMMQQAALLQQQSLYHPGLLAPPQIEPIPSGNLPPGFDPSTCRSVYVGNVHTQVTEPLLQEVFAGTGPVEGCKLFRKEKSSYGFIHYFDRRSAALAILTLNGRHLFGQPIKVNWAYASGQREDTSGHYNIFVGDLSPEVTDATLFACFSVYQSCSDARVMWDQKTGRSRGFGFVSFRSQQDAQSAINDLTGKWLGSRQIRCNWATKGAGGIEEKQNSDSKSVVELTNGSSEDGKEISSNDVPENNPQYTTVYVGNLGSEATQLDLHRHFHALGAGVIEEVRVQRVFPNVWKGPTLDLMAGSLSGGTTVLFTYMLDLIQTKLAYQVVRPTDLNVSGMVNNEQVYRGIHDYLSKTYKEGGIRGLYRGVAPTLFGIFPYSDLKFYFYEEMKLHVPEDYKKNIMAKLTCGSAAGSLGQTSHILLKLSGDKCRFKTLRHLKKPN